MATVHSWAGVPAVQVWDALAEQPTRAFQRHTFGVGKTIWIDENRLATCSGDHTVRVWNLQPGDSRAFIQPGAVTSARWSPDGRLLATSEENGHVRDAQTGQEVLGMQGRSRGEVTAIAWHPDGTRIVTGTDLGTIRVWVARSGRELLSMRELAEPVHWVGFSSDGTRLAAAGDDAVVKVWDATVGYVRSRSSWLLAALDQKDRGGIADADDVVARARIHAAAGNWEQAAAGTSNEPAASLAPSGSRPCCGTARGRARWTSSPRHCE